MPTLKQITCSIELGPSNSKLKEYGHRYTDGGVEAFVAVPETSIPFHVRVTSNGYIAPGLAVYAFMDGRYQCNRNRQRLRIPGPGIDPREYEVDFKLRQKEEKTAEDAFVGREWTFAKLETGNADSAPNTNPTFTENVGTIEVVVLRCKDGSTDASVPDFASAVAPAGPPVVRGSVTRTAHLPTRVEKAPSKAPSKAASRVASAAGDDMMGGMFGLFDGAGDDPHYDGAGDYHRYGDFAPGNLAHEPAIQPGYRWDTSTGEYRYHASEDPFINGERSGYNQATRPFTVHGGRECRDTGPIRDERAGGYYNQYRPAGEPQDSPLGHYDFQRRRAMRAEDAHYSPQPRPQRRAASQGFEDYRPQPLQRPAAPPHQAPDGFQFVFDICQQIETIDRDAHAQKQKLNGMQREAQMNENDPELHLIATKAVRQKQYEMKNLHQETQALYVSIMARMRRMDPAAWHYTRDYLVVERRLVPANHPEMQGWRDPRQHQAQLAGGARSEAPWKELGQGETGANLKGGGNGWDEQDNKSEQAIDWKNAGQNNNYGWVANNDNKGGGINDGNFGAQGDSWNNDQAGNDKQQQGDTWNNKAGGNDQGGDAWTKGVDNGVGNGQHNDDWNNGGQQNNDPRSRTHTSQRPSQAQGQDAWGNNDQLSSHSKTKAWDDGGNNQANDTWGNKPQSNAGGGGGWSNDKPKANAGGDWGNKPANKASSRGPCRRQHDMSNSTVVAPVIKPYWASWDQPDNFVKKPRAKPRDAYEYPALPAPAAAPSKVSSISHGVQAGRGAKYAHNMLRPEYLDTMQQPYAVFTFKYRSKAALEKILQRSIDTSAVKKAIDEAEKDNLRRLQKDELVEQMMKMKLKKGGTKAPSKAPSANAWGQPPAAKSASNGWGNKPASKAPFNHGWDGQGADEIKPSDSVSNAPWGEQADDNGGGGGGGGDWAGGAGGNNDTGWVNKSASKKTVTKNSDNGWPAPSGNKAEGAWGNNDKKSSKAGGGGAWGAANNGSGGDAGQEDKKSQQTQDHFGGDPDLKTTRAFQPTRSEAAAGW